MINTGLTRRREQTEKLRQVCVTAIGAGVNGALRSSFPVAQACPDLDSLMGKLNGVK